MKSVHQGSVLKLTSADDSSMLISCYANCQHSTTVVYIGPPEQASYGRACTAQQGSPGNLPSTDAACWWPRTPACPMRHPLVSPGRQGNAQRRHGAGATGRAKCKVPPREPSLSRPHAEAAANDRGAHAGWHGSITGYIYRRVQANVCIDPFTPIILSGPCKSRPAIRAMAQWWCVHFLVSFQIVK